jgi:hypothetical protein
MITAMPPQEFSLKNPPNPPEIECLGFKLSDVTMDFKKGYMQLGCGYKTVNKPRDQKVCDRFLDVLRNGPNDAMKMAMNMYQDPESRMEVMKDLKEEIDRQMEEKDLPREEQIERKQQRREQLNEEL